jgi:glycosyltransferase involved in cell wall biosynthesis
MMTETAYQAGWERITRRSYQDFGKPANITVLWQKPEGKSNIRPVNDDYKSISNSQKSSIPKFYVLTSCLNNADTIEETIHSIISQTGTFELHYCLLDRGSTDGTVDLLRMLDSKFKNNGIQAHDNNIHFSWYSVNSSDIYESICKGFDNMFIASHDFMTWINPGDILLPGALNTLAGIIQEHPDFQWLGSRQQDFENESIESVPGHQIPVLSKIIRRGSCDENHLSMLQRGRTFFKKTLWFKAKHALYGYREGGDLALWQEMVKHSEYYECNRSLMRIREGTEVRNLS